jgi:dihydrodipicolinate reductase
MGRELCRAALETEGMELAGGTVEPGAPELGADLGELCEAGRAGVVATEAPPDDAGVLVEFTTPEATVEHLPTACRTSSGRPGSPTDSSRR